MAILSALLSYRQNPNLPTPGYTHQFTQFEIDEFIKCKNSPEYFIEKYVKIVNIDRGLIPFALYNCQKPVIESFHKNKKTILLSPRQSGKSQMASAYLCWWIIFNTDKMAAILANKASTAREILSRVQLAYEHLPAFLKKGVITWNKGTIELDGNTKLIAASTAASSIRGLTIALLYCDEFGHVNNNIAEEFWTSTYPTISSGQSSKVIITSTPNGFNLFYKIWNEAVKKLNGFNPIQIHWTDIPGRDEKWKKDQLSVLGEDKFNQEFCNEFLGSSNTLIHPKFIKLMSADTPIAISDGVTIYQKPIRRNEFDIENFPDDHTYLMVVDPSEGTGNDNHAAVIFDISQYPLRIVAKLKDNKLSASLLPTVLERLGKTYNNAYVLVETNNSGRQVVDTLYRDLEYENVVQFGNQSESIGVKTTKSVKRQGCSTFKDLIENQKILINDADMISEISTFIQQKNSYSAESGAKDDLAMCCVLLSWFTAQDEFKYLTNMNFQQQLREDKMQQIQADILPFGFMDNGLNEEKPLSGGWYEVSTNFF